MARSKKVQEEEIQVPEIVAEPDPLPPTEFRLSGSTPTGLMQLTRIGLSVQAVKGDISRIQEVVLDYIIMTAGYTDAENEELSAYAEDWFKSQRPKPSN